VRIDQVCYQRCGLTPHPAGDLFAPLALLQVAQLADLLDKMLALDPDKRISADSALRHDFVKPFLPKKKPGSKH
jgi:serine/threonine protein kinase